MQAAKLVSGWRKERISATWLKVDTGDVGLFGRIDYAEFRLGTDENGAIESLPKSKILAIVDPCFVFLKVDDQRGAAVRKSPLFRVPGSRAFVNQE